MEIAWLEITDTPQLWHDLGFTVDDDGCCTINGVVHRLIGPRSGDNSGDSGDDDDTKATGIVAWGVRGIDPDVDSIDGIATVAVDDDGATDRDRDPQHPNGVFRIDHLVIRTSSTPRTVAAFESLGGKRRGGRTTNSAGDSVDMTFFWAGDTLLEVAGPPTPSADERPSRVSGLALATNDLDGAADLLGDLLTTPVDAVQPGRRIAALTNLAGASVPTAFMTPHVRTR